MERSYIHAYVLAKIDDDRLLVCKNLAIYIYSINQNKYRLIGRFPATPLKKILSHFRLTTRILRLEPRAVAKLTDNKYVISILHNLFIVDIQNKKIIKIQQNRNGFSDVLNICSADDSVYWGDYGKNPERECVNVYKMLPNGEIKIIYTFSAGTIRHIHNIIFDKVNEQFWIFTGDNESASGIYRVSKDWSSVSPYKVGQQKYRSVVGFPHNDGLIYATDSVESVNHIYTISSNGDEKVLCKINGSCIYGGETKSFFIFSTTVEPSETNQAILGFDNSTGKGILSKEVHIIAVNKHTLDTSVVEKFVKDAFPMRLLQYGVAKFAIDTVRDDSAICNITACKHYDGKAMQLHIQ
jgi:hypothetical protein